MVGHVPIRTCVICRRKAPKSALLRLVVRDRTVMEDPEHIAPGRGAYVCRQPACLSNLRCDKRLQKAFRGQVRELAPGVGLKQHLSNT
ncbi:MAG TPA: DUF448 domain-containing protein [Syntrophobacteraceae bacterium]|nr:DUF448 domain-containing protein [Syntrophobacteraceae bacterium]HBD09532.1 DUF448 domain-containing protein [Syntrophobacteraceae bacterium]